MAISPYVAKIGEPVHMEMLLEWGKRIQSESDTTAQGSIYPRLKRSSVTILHNKKVKNFEEYNQAYTPKTTEGRSLPC